MILTDKQLKELEEASKPLVKFLCDNFNPHVGVLVEPTGATIMEASATVKIEQFIKD